MKKKAYLLLFLAAFFALEACKKNNKEEVSDADEIPPATTDRTELSLDSIFLYAKQVYYWNSQLPTYKAFNPRQYNSGGSALDKYENALFGIASYSLNKYDVYKNIRGVYQSYPKFSYIDENTSSSGASGVVVNPVSAVELDGSAYDIGIRFGFYGTETEYSVYVTAVYKNSPAEAQGFARGDLITKVNGVSYGTNLNSESGPLNFALAGNTVTLEGVKGDGATLFNKTLTKAVFDTSPIYKTKVFTAGAKKIGYLSYARFSDSDNSVSALNTVFESFSNSGVTDLVIDLRYNGGGYVSTAEHLINLIAPSTATGVMFSEYYNATMQAGNAKLLSKQFFWDYNNNRWVSYGNVSYSVANNTSYFSKKGNLKNIRNVVFLVSGNTASSSELVINSLKPHMNVKLVGRTTYGKPVGFFPITIEKKYDVYYAMFETKNSAGEGGYYAGMTPDFILYELTEVRKDNAITGYKMVDFGDVEDVYLNQALAILAPNTSVTNDVSTMALGKSTGTKNLVASPVSINVEFADKEFKGMVENRFKLKN